MLAYLQTIFKKNTTSKQLNFLLTLSDYNPYFDSKFCFNVLTSPVCLPGGNHALDACSPSTTG